VYTFGNRFHYFQSADFLMNFGENLQNPTNRQVAMHMASSAA
jgi:hypothetical protein